MTDGHWSVLGDAVKEGRSRGGTHGTGRAGWKVDGCGMKTIGWGHMD